ncbi:MAG: HAD family hydrolase [Acidobacteria bacterium]|nr:MAG: HAD family hydrolase [Acidobacteriota bacterium]
MAEVLLSDIDGTLVDSNCLHADAWRRSFEQFGIQVRIDEVWTQIGKGGDQLLPVFLREADRERLEKPLTEFKDELFRREYLHRVVAFPMARELFMRVKESGTRIALATSSGKADLAVYKKIARIEDLVEEASSSDDAESSKPDPDIFAAALSMVQMRSDQAIALGDTPYDAEAAGKLGIPVIGLTCGGWKRDDLKDAGCIEVYMNPEALLREFRHSALAR